MTITMEISKDQLRKLVIDHLEKALGDLPFKEENLRIVTKSTQNYKSEWEIADFKATYLAIHD